MRNTEVRAREKEKEGVAFFSLGRFGIVPLRGSFCPGRDERRMTKRVSLERQKKSLQKMGEKQKAGLA